MVEEVIVLEDVVFFDYLQVFGAYEWFEDGCGDVWVVEVVQCVVNIVQQCIYYVFFVVVVVVGECGGLQGMCEMIDWEVVVIVVEQFQVCEYVIG